MESAAGVDLSGRQVLPELLFRLPQVGLTPQGAAACPAAIAAAFNAAGAALTAANGTPTVAAWKASTASKAAGVSMPAYDAIAYRTAGIAAQPDSDWQNRPTFQHVAMFPAHRPR